MQPLKHKILHFAVPVILTSLSASFLMAEESPQNASNSIGPSLSAEKILPGFPPGLIVSIDPSYVFQDTQTGMREVPLVRVIISDPYYQYQTAYYIKKSAVGHLSKKQISEFEPKEPPLSEIARFDKEAAARAEEARQQALNFAQQVDQRNARFQSLSSEGDLQRAAWIEYLKNFNLGKKNLAQSSSEFLKEASTKANPLPIYFGIDTLANEMTEMANLRTSRPSVDVDFLSQQITNLLSDSPISTEVEGAKPTRGTPWLKTLQTRIDAFAFANQIESKSEAAQLFIAKTMAEVSEARQSQSKKTARLRDETLQNVHLIRNFFMMSILAKNTGLSFAALAPHLETSNILQYLTAQSKEFLKRPDPSRRLERMDELKQNLIERLSSQKARSLKCTKP